MIKYEIDENEDKTQFKISGSGLEIISETQCLIRLIYLRYKSIREDMAETFKQIIIETLTAEDSPVWELPEEVIPHGTDD